MTALMLSLVVAGHMFGGMRTPLSQLEGAGLTVVGRVAAVTPRDQGVVELRVEVVAPLCGTPSKGPLQVFQLADHAASYAVGQLAVFPMTQAQASPHRPKDVDPNAWTVDQSQHETLWPREGEVAAVVDALQPLCAATPDQRVLHRVRLLRSTVPGVAGGAARDLLLQAQVPALPADVEQQVVLLMGDGAVAPGVRLAALHVGLRVGTPELLAAVERRVDPREPPELVAAAIKGLVKQPERLEPRLWAVLAGPAGVGRLTAARVAGARGFAWSVGPLVMLAFGSEPDAAQVACGALLKLGTPEASEARRGLVDALPGARRAACSTTLP